MPAPCEDAEALGKLEGGVESQVAHPATMTHAAMDAETHRRAGIGEALLRLSVGIEAADDLVRDLQAGLERAATRGGNRFSFGAAPPENSGLTRLSSGCILTLER